MADEKIIFSVEVENAEAIKAIENQTDKITELTNANERLRKEQKQLDTSTKEGLDERKRLGQQIAQNNDQLKEERAERGRLVKLAKTESNSLAALRQENAKLNKERANINTSTKEGQKRFNELTKEIKANKDAINEAEQAAGNFTGAVGSYKDAIQDSLSGIFDSGQGFGQMAGGIGQATKAAIKFIATPLGFIIAAIVVAIKALTAAFQKNEGATDKLSEIFAGFSAALDAVIGRVGRLIEIGGKLFKGQITLKEAANESKDAFKGLGDEMKNAYDEGVQLAKLQKQLEENTIKNTVAIAEQNAILSKNEAIYNDGTLSIKEREEAQIKAAQASRKAAEIERDAEAARLAEVQKRVEIATKNGSLNRKLRQEEADAMAAAIAAEANLTRVIFENQKARRELITEDVQQELDFIFDVSDVRKTANEKLIADDKLTFAQRRQILDETNKFLDESLNQQIEVFERFSKANIDVNKLMKLNNQEAFQYAKSLGLSDELTTRLLESIRERIAAQSDLSEAAADLNEKQSEFIKKANDELDAYFDKELEQTQASQDAYVDSEIAKTEALKSENEKRAQLYTDAFLSITNATAQFLTQEDASFKEFGKMLAASLLDQLQAVIIAKNAEILAKSLATGDSILSFGTTGAARAATIIAITTAAFGAAKAGLSKLEDGGEIKTGVFRGASHSAGGITLSADGVPVAEVEGNERFFVVNKKDSAMIDQLSAINSIHGKPFSTPMRYLADGGEVAAQGVTGQQVIDIIRSTPIFVKVTDINEGQAIRTTVINNGTV